MSEEARPQTDMERFIAFYASVGITLKSETWKDARVKPYSDERADLLVVELDNDLPRDKFGGQYTTWAVFDESGKFLYQWAGC